MPGPPSLRLYPPGAVPADIPVEALDSCLEDRRMTLVDHGVKYHPNWEHKDRKHERIESSLRQRSGSWVAFGEYLIPEHTPVSAQGNASTCAANAGVDMFEILMGLEHGPGQVKQLSRRFSYWVSRELTGDTDHSDGTYIRSVLHQLRTIGTFEEQYMPYSDDIDDLVGSTAAPEADHYTMASDNRINGFYRIVEEGMERISAIEVAVRANHPVIFGTPVSELFQRYQGGGYIWEPPSRDKQIGRHAMLITGVGFINPYNRKFFVRNSWGPQWGDQGHCWVHEDYLNFPDTLDIWVATNLEPII
jgi:C1A family cysteine protease